MKNERNGLDFLKVTIKGGTMKHVVIVGSGPSGAVAAVTLLEAGWKVTILDIGSLQNKINDPAITEQNVLALVKKFDNQNFPYDIDQHLLLSGPSKNWYTSKTNGGFSLVWGATWRPVEDLGDELWNSARSKVEELMDGYISGPELNEGNRKHSCSCFDGILERFKFADHKMKNNLKVDLSTMAVNSAKCNFSGMCHHKCGSDAIWTSLNFLKICEENPNFNYVPNTFIQEVIQIDQKVRFNTKNGSFESDFGLLAAGPVGNAAILLKSNFCEEILLKDTHMLTVPFLSLRRKEKHKGKFGLAGLVVDGEVSNLKFHLQLYGHPETFEGRILEALPKLLKPIWKFLFKIIQARLFIGILYLDSTVSGLIKLRLGEQIEHDYVKNKNYSTGLKTIKGKVTNLFFGLQVYPLWGAAKSAGIGDSYHVGSATGVELDEFGRLRNSTRIGVLGSFALPNIDPGPITYLSMTQAVRLAQHLASSQSQNLETI